MASGPSQNSTRAEIRPEVKAATQAQIEAANPHASRFASANAGSGKTKVLVDRVSRLLLNGTAPDKILCLTYTKAAANEMQTRLFEKLGNWSVLSAKKLSGKLDVLYGAKHKRSAEELSNARRLFASALETPEGLKVQTIHAFCERVLGRFPIEAGIAPGFEPLEAREAKALQEDIEIRLMEMAWAKPNEPLAVALSLLSASKADMTLEALFGWMGANARAIESWHTSGGIDPLASRLGLNPNDTPEDVAAAGWRSGPLANIKAAAQSLSQSRNAHDVRRGETILSAFCAENDAEAFHIYKSVVQTKSGTRLQSIATKSAPPAARAFWQDGSEPDRAVKITQNMQAQLVLMQTKAIYTLAHVYAKLYKVAKRARRVLDFNDQIYLVRDLLVQNDVAQWVKYKLDGGVEHILVDEAQDTSPAQWEIIEAIEENFLRPDPDYPHEKLKTFFAVGDEKQSIYSFQGARPEKFIDVIRKHTAQETDRSSTQNGARSVKMQMSFRSAQEILDTVDAVFETGGAKMRMFNPEYDPQAGDKVLHQAYRKDKGQVELWPLTQPPDDPPSEEPWDTRPVDAPNHASAREQLALRIARQVKGLLEKGEPIYDRNANQVRRLEAGDVLILVQRRNDFFNAIIRRLKALDVAVAGADRLVISEALAVRDLLALTKFVLLPGDDLALAETLKSPLFGWSDALLEEIAFDREQASLWQALGASSQKLAKEARDLLITIQNLARRHAPFEFYTAVLDITDKSGVSLKRKLYQRLGMEAQDALEAFLAQALAHQRLGAPSLQSFLENMIYDDGDIKREMDAPRGQVRVMTVHGAKGLEAPLVILPDTTRIPSLSKSAGLYAYGANMAIAETDNVSGFIYLPSKTATPPSLMPVREAAEQRQREEYLRLLYVAMTRAETRLIICGHMSGRSKKGYPDDCWYEEVLSAFDHLPARKELRNFDEKEIEVLVYGALPETANVLKEKAPETAPELPDWLLSPARREEPSAPVLTPSGLLAGSENLEPAVNSPSKNDRDYLLRGNLTHKLLEILPDITPSQRESAARKFLETYKNISDDMAASIRGEVMAILESTEFAPFFAPGSKPEVSLGGRIARYQNLKLSGQIDRLSVIGDKVYIIDYKSNRTPPSRAEDTAPLYLAQMGAYRDMVSEIYSRKQIICALLWTDGPRQMILSDKLMDAALTQAGMLPT